MDKIKWTKNEFEHYAKVLFLFMAGIVTALVMFFVAERSAAEFHTQDRLAKDVERQSYLLKLVLEQNYDYLEAAAGHIGDCEEFLGEDSRALIDRLYEHTNLDRTALIDEQGMATYNDGLQASVAERRYFLEAIAGQRTLSDPIESIVDGETRVILGVPIYKERRVIGVLGGSMNVTKLGQLLFEDVYGGTGILLIVNEEGTLVSLDGNAEYLDIAMDDNFFDYFNRLESWNKTSMADVEQGFEMQTSGCIKMWSRGNLADRRYMSYAPIGLNGWMLCYIVPETAAQSNYEFIRRYEGYLSIAFVCLVLLLVLAVFQTNARKQVALLRYAQTDALTGILNKQSTEEQIENFLSEQTEPGVHAFLMMDIDRFKNVNDRYGHVIGDEVLRRFGAMLKCQFRSDDIIGRIGGDEFVVFMKHVESKENAIARARRLGEVLRQIRLESMEEPIASSMGLAFAPEHGTSYLELYQCADIALYQTKQQGRNGFTVFQKKGRQERT